MILYLVRHGQDDSTVRGGWSNSPLTEEGTLQVRALAEEIAAARNELQIARIISSDLPRAVQTAQPTAEKLNLPIELNSRFREVNNGALAGMKNDLALVRYPGLFWNTLRWDEPYPDGESPAGFYQRIESAWKELTHELIRDGRNAMLVTHSGVIHIIRHLIHSTVYSNKEKQFSVPHARLIRAEYADGVWHMD
ncbi:MAG: histidine phosphatase family protein [Clostridia bacterium]|nr:histidine phosphatase family protein [Clostridia bacterium]